MQQSSCQPQPKMPPETTPWAATRTTAIVPSGHAHQDGLKSYPDASGRATKATRASNSGQGTEAMQCPNNSEAIRCPCSSSSLECSSPECSSSSTIISSLVDPCSSNRDPPQGFRQCGMGNTHVSSDGQGRILFIVIVKITTMLIVTHRFRPPILPIYLLTYHIELPSNRDML